MTMAEAEDDPRFLKGIDEFNRQLFFECHETLEEIWMEDHGEDRKFYQGIIQIAAGYFKLEQGVPAGALKLWRTGLEKLEPYGPVFLGISVESLVGAVKDHLAQLESGRPNSAESLLHNPPTIHFVC
jgi:predicted metal-dependent hydrolase